MSSDLLFEFFCKPIIERAGYNLVNTLVYGAILFALAFFVIFPFLDRKGIKFDLKFMLALIPFIFLGSSFRIWEDMGIVGRSCNPLELQFYTFTPGIYIAVFAITILSLAISRILAKKFGKSHELIFGIIGFIVALPVVLFDLQKFSQFTGFIEVIALTIAVIFLTKFAIEFFKKGFFSDKLNLLALAGQALDGSATVVSTQLFNCGEQHVVSNIVLQYFPPAFILIKVAFVSLFLYYVEKDVKSKNLQGFLKIVVIILGFAPGIRDLLTLAVGTCS